MEQGFIKANNSNLPRIDLMMLGEFLASNKDFCSAEFRNVKTSLSSRPSYGDDAISYVQLRREGNFCTVRCKICPEHKVHAKLYAVTLKIDEDIEKVVSVECHDCVAAQGGCKHAIALLMWVYRRSEEPSCTEVQCYWQKSKLSRVGTTLKYITAKDLSNGTQILQPDPTILNLFLEEGQKRKLTNCELFRYQPGYIYKGVRSASMHQLVLNYKEECSDIFLNKIHLSDEILHQIEFETRDQHKNTLWYELRYGRITASRVYEASRCQKADGTLMSLIMGGKIPDTPAMRRGRTLESEVRVTVSEKLGIKIKSCGLIISKSYPIIAGSPDGIAQDKVIEIKYPMSEKTCLNYVKNEQPTNKYYDQIQIQMYLSGLKECLFCVADPNVQLNKKVEIICVSYNEEYVSNLLKNVINFWKLNVYPLLYKSTE